MLFSFLKSSRNWLVKVHEDLDPKPLDPWLEEQQVLSRNRIQEEEEQRRLESEEPQSQDNDKYGIGEPPPRWWQLLPYEVNGIDSRFATEVLWIT